MIKTIKPMPELLKDWQEEKILTPLDRHFALEMAKSHQEDSPLFLLMCALLSKQLSAQHSCLVLSQIDFSNPMQESRPTCKLRPQPMLLIEALAQFSAIDVKPELDDAQNDSVNTVNATLANNNASADNDAFSGSSITPVNPSVKPLVLKGDRLYLQRYYHFETEVARTLTRLAQGRDDIAADPQLEQALQWLFPAANPHTADNTIDWQKVATATALTNQFSVITGGPGTGKTTTVTKLLFLLQLQQKRLNSTLNIRLVAPTGKAAARLSESIKASKARLATELSQHASQLDISALKLIPEEASTLHRLLGVIPNSHRFRHDKTNPLRLDLLIVDEASMVDLPMMYKLLNALPAHGRLILLGDQDQLASVEAGAVLADICAGLKTTHQGSTDTNPAEQGPWRMRYSEHQAQQLSALTQTDLTQFIHPSPKLGDSLCILMHSHRFKGDAGIGLLASAVNRTDLPGIQQVWQKGYDELLWREHTSKQPTAPAQLRSIDNQGLKALIDQAVEAYRPYLDMIRANQTAAGRHSPAEIIDCFNQFRLLCAMRAGDYGVEGINGFVTASLVQAKLISTKPTTQLHNQHTSATSLLSADQGMYLGRPIIIQSNDYNLGLFNGDIGLILQDVDKPERLMAHFIKADGSVLKVLPARLPNHETCYAMTVHKSQGSEFSRVALVLPVNPSLTQWSLLTKELIYTAITRAKQHFTCLGSQAVFERACSNATLRASGLALRLWD